MKKIFIEKKTIWPAIFVALIIIVLITSRALPLVLQGEGALGYDTGFYYTAAKATAKNANHFSQDIGRLGGIELILPFFKLISLVGLTPALIIYYIYPAINILLAAALGIFIREKYGAKSALLGVIIFTLSLTQFEAYQFFLFRTVLGLVLIFTAFYLIEKKSFLVFAPVLLLMTVNKSSPFVFLVTIIVYLALKKDKKICLAALGAALIGGLYAINFTGFKAFWDIMTHRFTNDTYMIREGFFIEIADFLKLSWRYFVPALYQIYRQIREKKKDLPFVFFAVSAVLVFGHFIFYKRLIIFLDLAAIILAASAFKDLLERYWPRRQNQIILAGFVIIAGFNMLYICNQPPAMNQSEINIIKSIRKYTEPNDHILSIDSGYLSWLECWGERPIISPGMSRDKWTYEEWLIFWENKDLQRQKEMLNRYPRPLYLYLGTDNLYFKPRPEIFEKINQNLYKYLSP